MPLPLLHDLEAVFYDRVLTKAITTKIVTKLFPSNPIECIVRVASETLHVHPVESFEETTFTYVGESLVDGGHGSVPYETKDEGTESCSMRSGLVSTSIPDTPERVKPGNESSIYNYGQPQPSDDEGPVGEHDIQGDVIATKTSGGLRSSEIKATNHHPSSTIVSTPPPLSKQMRPSTTVVFIIDTVNDRVLMTFHTQGQFKNHLTGICGPSKPGMTPLESSLEGIQDQTGLSVLPGDMVPRGSLTMVEVMEGFQVSHVLHIFTVDQEHNVQEAVNQSTATYVRWFPTCTLPYGQMPGNYKKWLPRMLEECNVYGTCTMDVSGSVVSDNIEFTPKELCANALARDLAGQSSGNPSAWQKSTSGESLGDCSTKISADSDSSRSNGIRTSTVSTLSC